MKRPAALIVTLLAAMAAHSLDLTMASGRFGVAIITNTEPTAPNPVLNTLGGSLELTFREGYSLTVEPALDVLWTNYEWYEDRRAAPTPAETGGGNNVFVLGFLIDLPVVASFRFSERLSGAVSAGPAFLFRASFAGDTTAAVADLMAANLAKVSAYFWQAGRFFYPSAALRFDVFLQEGFTFAIGVRGFLPLFNAWAGDAGFWDAAILHVTLAMRVDL